MNTPGLDMSTEMNRIQENQASPARPSVPGNYQPPVAPKLPSGGGSTSRPVFGRDYDLGWIGFSDRRGVLSDGIAWFERWDSVAAPRQSAANSAGGNNAALCRGAATGVVTHVFICANDNAVIQAHLGSGVAQGNITDLLDGPVYFRRPRGWTLTRGLGIVVSAQRQIGQRYNTPLIAAQALANTYLGHLVNEVFRGAPNRWVSGKLARKNAFICSGLAAFCLCEQPWIEPSGVLLLDNDTISPQMLFDDPEIWEN